MISLRKNRCIVVLILALLGSAAWADEPNETPIHVEFEISPTAIAPVPASRLGSSLWAPLLSRKPAYVAAIALVGWRDFLPYPTSPSMQGFMQFARQEAGLSEKQELFVTGMGGLFMSPHIMYRLDPNGPEYLWLYAVTLEDAQKMAQAYVQYATREFRKQVATAENQIRIETENIESTQKRITEIEKRSETARQSLDEFQKTVPYRTESEAHAAIGELDRMLNAAQVEIVGIKARISAIEVFQGQRQGRANQAAAVTKLDIMFIEESIALRGAQAREQMATRLREQANRFVDLKSTLANAPGEKKRLAETLETAQRGLSSWQSNLASLKQKEPKIPAKIVIYPVQWADEAAQN